MGSQSHSPQSASGLPEADQQAVALVAECFGNTSPESLRFARFVVERNGLEWLEDRAPAATAEVPA